MVPDTEAGGAEAAGVCESLLERSEEAAVVGPEATEADEELMDEIEAAGPEETPGVNPGTTPGVEAPEAWDRDVELELPEDAECVLLDDDEAARVLDPLREGGVPVEGSGVACDLAVVEGSEGSPDGGGLTGDSEAAEREEDSIDSMELATVSALAEDSELSRDLELVTDPEATEGKEVVGETGDSIDSMELVETAEAVEIAEPAEPGAVPCVEADPDPCVDDLEATD